MIRGSLKKNCTFFSLDRHETCINRLRMRYIEFLEDQQSRDERNHKLLGALDRVDSSLALMSAKTDRLGALRVSQFIKYIKFPHQSLMTNKRLNYSRYFSNRSSTKLRCCVPTSQSEDRTEVSQETVELPVKTTRDNANESTKATQFSPIVP